MRRTLVIPLIVAVCATQVHAGGILGNLFGKKPKGNPAEAVKELVQIAKSDPDERRRVKAIEELRQYDSKQYPIIAQTVMESLLRDPSAPVRSEAAETLGKVRPITSQAGYALEQVQNNDSSMRVRLAAKQALWHYHLAGYRGGNAKDGPQSSEPPLAGPNSGSPAAGNRQPPPPQVNNRRTPTSVQPVSRGGIRETAEPPLAAPSEARPVMPAPPIITTPPSPPRSLSHGPIDPPLIPLDGLNRPTMPPKRIELNPPTPPARPAELKPSPSLPKPSEISPAKPSKSDEGPRLNPPM
jgi:hypothetical protein